MNFYFARNYWDDQSCVLPDVMKFLGLELRNYLFLLKSYYSLIAKSFEILWDRNMKFNFWSVEGNLKFFFFAKCYSPDVMTFQGFRIAELSFLYRSHTHCRNRIITSAAQFEIFSRYVEYVRYVEIFARHCTRDCRPRLTSDSEL